ncbi:MAG: aminoacyl-tRNA hydrolase [Gammaproteobacteria bacterium]|nr:MAG: aminoacyl-tRNA hydrolase [Gammaproteobacteria bacterium]
MSEGIQLIAGLGNPGPQYSETRHNAGFRFMDALLHHCGSQLRAESRFDGEVGKARIANRDVWLIRPTTFMNLSGDGVGKLARFYKVAPENILVVHDELDLPPGAVRLKIGGGHGGHNGLRDIVPKLGSKDFIRLRVGIGHPGSASQVTSYVLKKAPPAEQRLVEDAIDAAIAEIDDIVCGDYQPVMNRLHTHTVHS